MAEYIERNAAIEAAKHAWAKGLEPSQYIEALSAADVAPVVHGQWDDSGRYTFPSGDVAVRCTNCGCALTESEYRLYNWNYCPICGAKMDIKNGGDSDAGN